MDALLKREDNVVWFWVNGMIAGHYQKFLTIDGFLVVFKGEYFRAYSEAEAQQWLIEQINGQEAVATAQ